MSIQINRSAQFDSFVDFAHQSISTGQSKAVARSSGEVVGTGDLASRTIKPATTDRAFALFRSKADKTANDAARELFRQSVADMFGGESKIPASVKEAMLVDDYGAGKPLTARRIMAVKHAIDIAVNPIHAEVTQGEALQMVSSSLQFLNAKHAERKLSPVTLTPAQMLAAADLIVEVGKQIGEQNLKLVANFTVLAVANAGTQDVRPAVIQFRNDVLTSRNFLPGDKRFAAVDKKVTEYMRASLAEYLSPDKADMFEDDGVFKQFHLDVVRSESTTINGQKFTTGGVRADGGPGTADDMFRAVVKPQHRKAISCFLNQQIQSTATSMMFRIPLPLTAGPKDGMDISGTNGLGMVTSFSPSEFYGGQMVHISDQSYKLDVSEDGKRARLSVDLKATINPRATSVNSGHWHDVVGIITFTQEITFNLTKNPPTIIAAHVGHTVEA